MDALPAAVASTDDALEPVRVVAQPSLFRAPSERRIKTVAPGATILELILDTGMAELRGAVVSMDGTQITGGTVHLPSEGRLKATIGGREVPQHLWHHVRPKPGQLVNIYLAPANQRQAIIIGASILIAVAAAASGGALAAPGGALAASIGPGAAAAVGAGAAAAISIGGALALNAFLPPETPDSDEAQQAQRDLITGQSNQIIPDARVPVILGAVQLFPYHYAKPYTEKVGNNLYWRILLCVGQGPLRVQSSNVKINGIDVDTLGSNQVEYEIREGRLTDDPLTLFTQNIDEINPSTAIGGQIRRLDPNDGYIQTTSTNTTEISVDLTWPSGIFRLSESGSRDPYYVNYRIEISPTGAGTWTDFETGDPTPQEHAAQGSTTSRIIKTHRRTGLAAGQYDVRVKRRTGDQEPDGAYAQHSNKGRTYVNGFYWTALRSVRPTDPRPDKTIACVALRVKRSESGVIGGISVLAESYALDWNGAAWVEAVTSNPASLGRHLLQGSPNPNPEPDSKMDLPSWEAGHDYCVTESWEFNGLFGDKAILMERLPVVLKAGRMRLIPDAKIGVAIDQAGKTMSGMITPRNSRNFEGLQLLSDPLHALRAKYINSAEDWQQDELIVYADGYDAESASDGNILTLDLTKSGIVTHDLVWRRARYELAWRALRPGAYSVEQSYEQFRHVPGDLVGFQHDVPIFGQASARITGVTLNGSSQVIACTIDDSVTMEMGGSYAARVRLIDDSDDDQFIQRDVTTVPGTTKSLAFAAPFDATASPKVDDLLSFGELPTVDCIVKEVLPGPNDTARIVLIDDAPGVYTADRGTIPDYSSQITAPSNFFGVAPAVPTILRVSIEDITLPSQPDVVTSQQLIVQIEAISSGTQPPESYEVEVKRSDQDDYQERHSYPGDATDLRVPVVGSNATYDVRVRALGALGGNIIIPKSAWSTAVSVFVPIPQVVPTDVAKVAGLELYDQGNDSFVFEGPDVHVRWRLTAKTGSATVEGAQNQITGFIDPTFSWYEVQVIDPDTGYVRHTDLTQIPEYVYPITKNREDSIRQAAAEGGSTRPRRQVTIAVAFVDKFSRRSTPQTITVSNPAPAAPSGLLVSGKAAALYVKANVPADGDFEKIVVLTSGSPGTPLASMVRDEAAGSVYTKPQDATGTTLFVRVAMADRFSDNVADLNFSSEIAVPIEEAEGPPQFTPSGLRFTTDVATNTVRWTSGVMQILDGATVIEEAIAAGQTTWTAGTLWLYYVRGSNMLAATTNSQEPIAKDRVVVAQYFGGDEFTVTNVRYPVANLVTQAEPDNFQQGITAGWQTLVELEPITTAGNPVVLTAMIEFDGSVSTVESITARARIRFVRDGNVLRTFGLISESFSSGSRSLKFLGTIEWDEDRPAGGTYTYTLEGRVQIDTGSPTAQSMTWQYRKFSAQEALR